ncbi:hypothetical protein [Streptomyces sp. NPDC059224]|uniref:hypothetical protein n=1 Tax=Streptomyces sp. NPDC059224 TaxID=3346775 RepID=UPI0036AA9D7F
MTSWAAAENRRGRRRRRSRRLGYRTTFLTCTCLVLVFAALAGSHWRRMADAPRLLQPSAKT